MGNKSSSSVTIIPAEPAPMGPDDMSNKLALGAGCYWGTEKFVKKSEWVSQWTECISVCVAA